MAQLIFRNASVIDGTTPYARAGSDVLIEDSVIREVSDGPITSPTAELVDLRGQTLMPGLIDCHVHVIASSVNLGQNAALPNSLVALQAARIMEGMLDRGFTSVRDAGGADHGLVLAQETGLIRGPRLFISGKALTQTGGHADVTFDALAEEGESLGLPPESVAKIDAVRSAGLRSLELFRDAGIPMGYGTDLLGSMHRHQLREFAIRGDVLPAHEVVASATSVGAKILGMEGKLGVVAPGALADLLILDRDPLADLSALDGTHIRAVVQGGEFVRDHMV